MKHDIEGGIAYVLYYKPDQNGCFSLDKKLMNEQIRACVDKEQYEAAAIIRDILEDKNKTDDNTE